METNDSQNTQDSRKRPSSQISGENDNSIEAQLEEMKAELADRNAAITEFYLAKRKSIGIERELAQLKKDKAELQAELDDTQIEMEDKGEEYKEEISTRDNEINELNKQHSMLLGSISDLMDEVEDNNQKIVDLTNNAENALNLVAENEQKIGELKDALQKSEDAVAAFEKRVTTLENELNKAKNAKTWKPLQVESIYNDSGILYNLLGYFKLLDVRRFETEGSTIWKLYSSATSKPLEMDVAEVFRRTRFEFCLYGKLACSDKRNKKRIKEIIPRVWSCSLTSLKLVNQDLDEYDFVKLVSSKTIKTLEFDQVTIKRSKNEYLVLCDILKKLPNVESFKYQFGSKPTVGNFEQLVRFEKLKRFMLYNCSAGFPLEAFGEFVKKHENVEFSLRYVNMDESVQAGIRQQARNIVADSTCRLPVAFD